MKKKAIIDTLKAVNESHTDQGKIFSLLVGIYELLIAIADKFDCFEDEEDEVTD